ncbi:MAG: hypothetical protein AB8C95_07810 [Phycisphaeraceae bacterium]
MKRPFEVTPICILLIAASVLGLFSYGDERGWFFDIATMFSMLIVMLFVIGFWFGGRLSHCLLVFFAVYAMLRPVLLVVIDPSWFDTAVMVTEAVLAVPLLLWLLTKRIDTFTKQVREKAMANVE